MSGSPPIEIASPAQSASPLASATDAAREATRRRAGVVYSLGAYAFWGLVPLYLRLVKGVTPLEFLTHRMLWSALVVFGILAASGRRWEWLGRALRSWSVLRSFIASAAVLSVNWFVFVWAVDAGKVVDASLGYFINPLLTVALGALVLKERLRRAQVAAVVLAAAGVCWLIIQVGQVPWVGLTLAASFATYGLLRKTAALGPLEGLAVETLLLSPVAIATLGWFVAQGQSEFVAGSWPTRALIMLAGPLTTVPLLLFAAGARRVPLSILGLLQYLSPTLQLLLGVLLLHEPFNAGKLVGYSFIWLGFVVASVDSLRTSSVSGSS